jgi:D-beta-D-heptose 7-phosphate kinase/D-beta-D-heptose 1-phosphate adenosyltransferase
MTTNPQDGHALHSLIERFSAARVLCVGDLMLDRYVYGRVERISAEAPIQVLHIDSERAMLGGVGNVARNVAALGARAVLVAVTGDDGAGGEIAAMAEAEGRLDAELVVEPGRRSTVKTRYIAAGQQLLRADDETTRPVHDDTARQLVARIESVLSRVDAVVISDYAKGVLADAVLRPVIESARSAGVPVVVDPKRRNLSPYAGASVLKPNQAELAAATGLPCESDDQVVLAARKALAEHGFDAVMVSRSARGICLVTRSGETLHLRAQAREVYDVSGAGDTVVATTAVALAAGADAAAAARLANLAGGIVVGKLGTAAVTRDELASALLAAEVSTSEAKIVSAQAAADAVARWRAHGLRIGFTNRGFDVRHPGHGSLLTAARASCDRLIVGLNSDESVRRLKGEDRPIQGEAARALVIASLSMVDLVVIFDDDTPIPLLELLKPDVLVKGGDYTIDQVVGADVVRAYGGEVKLATLVPGHSSSRVIARLSNRGGGKA